MPNPDGTVLDVTIYNEAGDVVATFHEEDGESVDYVSFVTDQTYGKPALIAPGKTGDARSAVDDEVLYLNNSLLPFYTVVRRNPQD